MATRTCYICGRESARRVIVEPLMLPVCLDKACERRAAALPVVHCSARTDTGELCGAPALADLEAEGHRLCARHLQLAWSETPVA